MHAKFCTDSADVLIVTDIPFLGEQCLASEYDRHFSENSLKELRRYLGQFARYCRHHPDGSVTDLNPDFIKTIKPVGPRPNSN